MLPNPPSSDDVMRSINPNDERLIAEYPPHTQRDLVAAFRKAGYGNPPSAPPSYQPGSHATRRSRLTALAEQLRQSSDRLAELMTLEMGKPIGQSKAEIEKSAQCCDYYAEHAESMLAAEVVQTEASVSEVRYMPLGVILAIMPWNFPVWQVIRHAVPALAAGNRILLKHAPNVCGCAELIESLFNESFGPGALSHLRLSNERTQALIRDPIVAGVAFTGSEMGGRRVAATAGESLKKCVLELGGVDPFIVMEDVDVEAVAEKAVQARIQNNGQSCIAAKRFIVMPSIADEFTECVVEKMKALQVGDPMDPATELGPLAREDLRDKLHDQVRFCAQTSPIDLLCGGQIPDRPGWFYPATVLRQEHVDSDNHIRETFGPVAMIEVATDQQNWLSMLAHTDYGLSASIWTEDLDRARQIMNRIPCGALFINEIPKSDVRLPFGGVRDSGFGRELSSHGLKEFTNVQAVWIR